MTGGQSQFLLWVVEYKSKASRRSLLCLRILAKLKLMSYVGGKARRSSFILDLINSPTFDGWHYVEPFCGYCNVVRRVVNKKTLAASDCHPLLCSLLRAVQAGAPLPSHITRERYYQLKTSGGDSVERAAACFGFSFNGKAWGGYTSSYTRPGGKTDDIWATRRRYYQRLCGSPGFAASTLTQADYRTAIGTSAATVTPQTTLIYLDPPYANTTGYGGTPRFDSAALWQTAREWSRRGAVVLVSEYNAPPDFATVATQSKSSTLAGGDKQTPRTERLFAHTSCLPRLPPSYQLGV